MGGVGPPPPSPLPNRYSACADGQHLLLVETMERRLTGDFKILVVGHSSSDLVNITPDPSAICSVWMGAENSLSTIGINRRHMGEDLRAIETDPIESRVREGVAKDQLDSPPESMMH
jgi:hypothetical protein